MERESLARFAFTGRQSASNKMPREINRNLVFNLIRIHQPLSRADLARISGLQRSTISLITETLIREGWVSEGATVSLPRGRSPTVLHLNHQRAVIALDIQPSAISVAAVDLGGAIIAQNKVALPDDPAKVIQTIVREVKKILALNGRTFDGIGITIPGRPETSPENLVFTPRIRWPVLDLKARLQRTTGLRVKMDNVANACVLSEVWFGESDGIHDLVVVNVSEGIGTGIFVNGRILRGRDGMAGEFGHVQIESDGPLCPCGGTGCWESFASNRAALRYYQEITGKPSPPAFESPGAHGPEWQYVCRPGHRQDVPVAGTGPAHDRLRTGADRDRGGRRDHERLVPFRSEDRSRDEAQFTAQPSPLASFRGGQYCSTAQRRCAGNEC